LSSLHILESGALIIVHRPAAERPGVCLINVTAKTPEAAVHAKTLIKNAVDAVLISVYNRFEDINTGLVDNKKCSGGDDAIAAPDAGAMQTVLLTAIDKLDALTVGHLRAGLECYGLPSRGNQSKKTFIARLAAHANDSEDGAEASVSYLSFAIPYNADGSPIGDCDSLLVRPRAGE
jgi:hypothetical protein